MNYFEPSAWRARECRLAMETALWKSVGTLLGDAAAPPSRFPQPIGSAYALDFGTYSDLHLSHPADGELAPAVRETARHYLMARVSNCLAGPGVPASPPPGEGLPRISTLLPGYYSVEQIATLRRWWDIEPENALCLTAVPMGMFEKAQGQMILALERMRQCAPELYGETLEIVHDIVVVLPGAPTGAELGGVSSFALWGALAINPATQDIEGWVHYFKTIVHEAGHNLLFALARDEPLVGNDPEERYSSPLRTDPRPMDGIFHAAFVSARESLALDRLLTWHDASDVLSPADLGWAEAFFENAVIAFWQCSEILRGQGRLTRLGQAILDDCEAFMASEFTLVTN